MKGGRRALQSERTIKPVSNMARHTGLMCGLRWASGRRQQIDVPSCGYHDVLEIGQEPPGDIHVAGARPWPADEMSGEDIE
jgi:hypothetical protein